MIRSIPQNFSGGQNPGVGSGASLGGLSNANYGGGSALNLRGLGPDATLTLLNGRRISYGSFSQSVDISAIPVEAVERIEMVTDGASAIYGSDAVGGVANVVLKREYDGVTVGARHGTATEGGRSTRDYTATGGATWSTGGLIATALSSSSDPIFASQRVYTRAMPSPRTIYPGLDSNSGLVNFHQSMGDVAELRLDAFKTRREQQQYLGYTGYYYEQPTRNSIWRVSPSVVFFLPADWTLTIGGAWGRDEVGYGQYYHAGTAAPAYTNFCFCNRNRSYEAGAEGPLFAMAGGDARLAVGVGSHTDTFAYVLRTASTTGTSRYGGDEFARYGYAELSLPFISPGSQIPGIRRLEVSAAGRVEDYHSYGQVTTPKLGLIYDPGPDVTFKASWGKSFKAPTLYQKYTENAAYLMSTNTVGGSGYPADATVLMSYGGNPGLKPERARTWSASLVIHPEALPGLEAELTWFDIDYRDRVVQPLASYTQALSNPDYAEYVRYSPTDEAQSSLLSRAGAFYSYVGAYDPDKVVAIISDEYVNAASQRVRGMDLSGTYRWHFGGGHLNMRGSVSYLESRQQTSTGQDTYDLAGTIFNPAGYKGRLGLVWKRGGFSAAGFLNYTSGVTNTLTSAGEKTASFSTFDATLNYDTGERDDVWKGVTFGVSVENLFNRAPPLYPAAAVYYAPYDSTNYSAIGRFVSVSLSKHW